MNSEHANLSFVLNILLFFVRFSCDTLKIKMT